MTGPEQLVQDSETSDTARHLAVSVVTSLRVQSQSTLDERLKRISRKITRFHAISREYALRLYFRPEFHAKSR